MGFWLSEFYARFSFGLLAFIPKKLYMGLRLSEFYARFSFGLLVFTPKRIIYEASVIRVWCKIPLRTIGFHLEVNNTLYGVSAIYILWKIILRVIGLHPEAMHGYIWKWLCLGLTKFYLAFGYWCTWKGCTEESIPLSQAKRGVIGALQVNATWRNEPRAREAERPAAPFGPSS